MDTEHPTERQAVRPDGEAASLRAIAYLCQQIGGFPEKPTADQEQVLHSLGLSGEQVNRVLALIGRMEEAQPVIASRGRLGGNRRIVPQASLRGALLRPFGKIFEGLPWWIRCQILALPVANIELVRRIRSWSCPISWQPSVATPVFYGVRDYDTVNGAPGPLRVYYPTLGGSVNNELFLQGCGDYPLAIFLHGHCTETDHYKRWQYLPAMLAHSGFVVAVPKLPGIQSGSSPFGEPESDLILAEAVLWWMRSSWEYRAHLLCPPSTGIVGHSYGALLGVRLASRVAASAYVSLGGGWGEWTESQWSLLNALAVPSLFVWGSRDQDSAVVGTAPLWNRIKPPKHKLVLEDAGHWDYLPEGQSTCARGHGACHLLGMLAGDLTATFLSKRTPPERWSSLRASIGNNLLPPNIPLTPEQLFYTGGHLNGLKHFSLPDECRATLSWELPGGVTGSHTLN